MTDQDQAPAAPGSPWPAIVQQLVTIALLLGTGMIALVVARETTLAGSLFGAAGGFIAPMVLRARGAAPAWLVVAGVAGGSVAASLLK